MIISIITINYNNVEGLKKTLDSIASQSVKEFELVIVDGGSHDGSKQLIEKKAKIFSHLTWISEPDKGIYNAMNKGTRMAKGDYCIFMNSGDCFYKPSSLSDSIAYLDGNVDIISGSVKTDTFSKEAPEEEDLSLSFFVKNSMNHQSTFIKRTLLLQYPYNEGRKIVGDSEFFFQTLILNNASYLKIHIFVSYCEAAGESGNLEKSMQERFLAIKELLPKRMKDDVDFIVKYHNPILMKIGNILYNKPFRKIYFMFNRIKERINR